MVRFIFICIGIVILSGLSVAGQSMIDGIENAHGDILARNKTSEPLQAIPDIGQALNPESLNDIKTAADGTEDDNGNMAFGPAFQTAAPAALRDAP